MKSPEPACIQSKREAAARWYAQVKDLTRDERLAFYEQLNREFRKRHQPVLGLPTSKRSS